MAIATNLGYPRIGPDRELKRALEAYWRGEIGGDALRETGARVRETAWRTQRAAGVEQIPSNDFSLYDQVLDTVALLGAVPERYGWDGEVVDLDTYFAMARGAQTDELDVGAMEMTKWFDTNYHYIVPEFRRDQEFRIASSRPFEAFEEALELGITTRPVLLGPFSFLLLGKAAEPGLDPLDHHLGRVADVYGEILRRLGQAGAEWVQIDEPCLVEDRSASEIAAFQGAYRRITQATAGVKVLVQTYFGHVGEAYGALADLPIDGIGLDFVDGPENLDLVREHGFPDDKWLSAGVVSGRNVWVADMDETLDLCRALGRHVATDRLMVAPSCSLLHVPHDASRETHLDTKLRRWLSFARQKLAETVLLTRGVNGGRSAIERELESNREALASREGSPRTRSPSVRRRMEELDPASAGRSRPFGDRRPLQEKRLGLPALPTTTIGSFPQHDQVRSRRRAFQDGDLDRDEYEDFLRDEIERCVGIQEEVGLDVLVHGEFERNDMVEYFARRFDGFAFTRHGWVQSYGSRCVKPPILYGDVRRPEPISVRWWDHAASCTERPVKAMLTGPVTMLQWSYVRDDQPRSETTLQLALAVRDEVVDLEAAGAPVIQVDEPALREGLPLREEGRDDYLDWTITAFRVATGGVEPATQVHTHMCYSEFNDIIEHVARMDADVLLIENARSDEELLEVFREFDYPGWIGPGVYDIHSPRVPPTEEMADRVRASLSVLPAGLLWVNPDCGLKTRRYEEVEPALENMVEAARRVRAEIDGGHDG